MTGSNQLPIRLLIKKRLTTILSNITPDAGFNHDMKGRVFRGRATFGDNDVVPMISILESPAAIEQMISQADNTGNIGFLELHLQGFLEDDFNNPTDPAHMLMADVKKALALEKKREDKKILGVEQIMNMEIGGGVVRPPDEISNKAYFWLTIVLKFYEDMLKSYDSGLDIEEMSL